MESFEEISPIVKTPNINDRESGIEAALENERRGFVLNISETVEQLSQLENSQGIEYASQFKEKMESIVDFFKRNNGENAKLVGYGLAIAFGKTAVDLISFADLIRNVGLQFDFPTFIETYFHDTSKVLENLMAGIGSALAQSLSWELKRAWSYQGEGIKESLPKSINGGLNKLTKLYKLAYGQA